MNAEEAIQRNHTLPLFNPKIIEEILINGEYIDIEIKNRKGKFRYRISTEHLQSVIINLFEIKDISK